MEVYHKIQEALYAANVVHLETVSRSLFPSSIRAFPEHLNIEDDHFIKCIVVGIPENPDIAGYPDNLDPHIIRKLLAIEGQEFKLSFSYGVRKLSTEKATELLTRADELNDLEMNSYNEKGHDEKKVPIVKKLQAGSLENNITAVYQNDENMFETSFIITIKSKHLRGLRDAQGHIESVLGGARIGSTVKTCKHLDTLLNATMRPSMLPADTCQIFSWHAGILLPIKSFGNRLDDEGLLIGETIEETPRPVQIDFKGLAARHMLGLGATGVGKSYLMQLLIMRELSMEGHRVIEITPKADDGNQEKGKGTDHKKVCVHFKGCLIELGRGKEKIINPLHIFTNSKVSREDAENVYYQHVDTVAAYFQALILSETEGRDNMIPYLLTSIHRAYEAKGIFREDPKSWHDFPVSSDLYSIWESEKEKNQSANALWNKGSAILTNWDYLNQQSNIDLSNNLLVFDTSGMSDSTGKLQDAFNVLIVAMMAMRFHGSIIPTTIFVDEARVFFQNKSISKFLMKLLLEGRSANIGLALFTQNPADLKKANIAEEVLGNVGVVVAFGGMSAINIGIVSDFLSMSEATKDQYSRLIKGQGLVMYGNRTIPTSFKSTPYEHGIITGLISSDQTLATVSTLQFILPGIEKLFNEQKICFLDWINCDPELLKTRGLTNKKGVDCMTGRNVQVWIKEVPTNQKPDHFSTICRLAGEAIKKGHTVKINHFDDADIIIDERIAVEYERPGSHSFQELVEKRDAALLKYQEVFFVCQNENYELVKKAVGIDRTIMRGAKLKAWLENL